MVALRVHHGRLKALQGTGDGATRWYHVTAMNLVGEGPASSADDARTFVPSSAPGT